MVGHLFQIDRHVVGNVRDVEVCSNILCADADVLGKFGHIDVACQFAQIDTISDFLNIDADVLRNITGVDLRCHMAQAQLLCDGRNQSCLMLIHDGVDQGVAVGRVVHDGCGDVA